MSGIFFGHPGVRFPRRVRFFEIMMRGFASSLLRWLTVAAGGSTRVHFRLDEAEFPTVSQSACKLFEWTLPGSRAVDCASIGALRPLNNWVNLKDQYELLFTWETPAPSARRVPTIGRSPALPRNALETAQENILAASRRILWKRERQRRKKASDRVGQWHAALAAGAQA
jgi:hypothetical protein